MWWVKSAQEGTKVGRGEALARVLCSERGGLDSGQSVVVVLSERIACLGHIEYSLGEEWEWRERGQLVRNAIHRVI